MLGIVAVLVGGLFVWIFFAIKKQTRKLESNGAFDISLCQGKVAGVYLRIPAEGNGMGKIQISINGSVHEVDAKTCGEEIPSGSKVYVSEVIENYVMVVKE